MASTALRQETSSSSSEGDSSIHRGIAASFQSPNPTWELLLQLQSTSGPFTDVKLIHPTTGAEVRVHRIIFNTCPPMKARFEKKDLIRLQQPSSEDHISLKIPERFSFKSVIKCVFLAYLGEGFNFNDNNEPLPREWFGLNYLEFNPEQGSDPNYSEQLHKKLEKFFVRYSKKGKDFLMDWRGQAKPVCDTPVTLIQLFCGECGQKFHYNEHIDAHENSTCGRYFPVKRYTGHPSYECGKCGESFVKTKTNQQRIPRRDSTALSTSSISGELHNFVDSIRDTGFCCLHCRPVLPTGLQINTSTPRSPPARNCETCLQVFSSQVAEEQHDESCDGEKIVFNPRLRVDHCYISGCHAMFKPAKSILEGIFHHVRSKHGLIHNKHYTLFPRRLCLACKKFENPGSAKEFFHHNYDCFQAVMKSSKKGLKKKFPKILQIQSILPDPDISDWFNVRIPRDKPTRTRNPVVLLNHSRVAQPNNVNVPTSSSTAPRHNTRAAAAKNNKRPAEKPQKAAEIPKKKKVN